MKIYAKGAIRRAEQMAKETGVQVTEDSYAFASFALLAFAEFTGLMEPGDTERLLEWAAKNPD